MHVFVTGGTGFVGKAVVNELLAAGHRVTALARSDETAAALKEKGCNVLRGSIQDPEILKRGAKEADGVIYLAFTFGLATFAESCMDEKSAIETLGSALIGTNKPLITTCGTLALAKSALSTEDDVIDFDQPLNIRCQSENVVDTLAKQGVRACVIRLPPTVHGEEDNRGFIRMMTEQASSQGHAFYIGEGLNHWPAVHRYDAAHLYRLALEKGVAGSKYHAVAEDGVTMKDIAEAIGQSLRLETVSKTAEEAKDLDSILRFVMVIDNPTSGKKTQDQLGWVPAGRKLLEDIKARVYVRN